MDNPYFRSLKGQLPNVAPNFVEDCLTSSYDAYSAMGKDTLGLNQASECSYNKTRVISQLRSKLGTGIKAHYFRMPPHSCYNWHVDVDTSIRYSAINYKLDDTPSTTLFKAPSNDRLNFSIVECKYVQYEPMLFNTQLPHCVLNTSSEYRHMMTICLNIPFEQAVAMFNNDFWAS